MRISLKVKLSGIMIALLFVAILLVTVLSVRNSQSMLSDSIDTGAAFAAGLASQQAESLLAPVEELAAGLSMTQSAQKADEAAILQETLPRIQRYGSLQAVYIGMEQTGKLIGYQRDKGKVDVISVPADYNPRTRDWYKAAATNGKPGFTKPYVDATMKNLVVTVYAPVKDASGRLVGVAAADVALDDLTAMLSKASYGKGGYTSLIDQTGVILVHPKADLLGKNISEVGGKLAEISKDQMAGKTGTAEYTEGGASWDIFYTPIARTGWSVGVHVPASELTQPINTMRMWALLVGAASLIIGGLLAYLLALQLVRPINKVREELARVADGEGDLTERISFPSRDEIGDLADAFNRFMAKLESIIKEVRGHAIEVDDGSTQLAEAISQQATATGEMAQMISSVARGAEEQNKTALEAQQSVEQLSDGIAMIADGAQSQAAIVEQTRQAARQMVTDAGQAGEYVRKLQQVIESNASAAKGGSTSVQSVVAKIGDLHGEMEKTVRSVETLDEGSRKIGAIVEAINGIAEQTNLLALNAAIEAARAGEHGRGFAVVAQEVRVLAEKSRHSTQEISGIIQQLAGAIHQTVEAMRAAGHQVEEGSRLAEEAGRSLGLIVQEAQEARTGVDGLSQVAVSVERSAQEVQTAMDRLAAVAVETAEVAQQMTGASQGVILAAQRITDISQRNAAGAEEGAASAEEMSASAEEITATGDTLSHAAKALESLVGRFKVSG